MNDEATPTIDALTSVIPVIHFQVEPLGFLDGTATCAAALFDPPHELAVDWRYVRCQACVNVRVARELALTAARMLVESFDKNMRILNQGDFMRLAKAAIAQQAEIEWLRSSLTKAYSGEVPSAQKQEELLRTLRACGARLIAPWSPQEDGRLGQQALALANELRSKPAGSR